MIQAVAAIALLALGGAAVWIYPRSILAFLTFQGALMAVYVARMPAWLRLALLGVGLLEAFAASYLSLLTGGAFGAEYKDIFAFSVLILILIFRPKGLLGEVVRERA